MSDLKVCRICLCKDVKVFNYDRYHLKQYYEEVVAKKVNEKDGLPNYFCYECAAMLYKFHKFKEKCWTGEKALQELLWSGSITLSSISQIDRQNKSLQSPIGILSVSKRVRTCLIKSKSLLKEIKNVEIGEECKVNYDSDNSLNNKNLAEIKNIMINENSDSIIEDEKAYIDTENIDSEEKALPDYEDDRMFSEDEDSNPESVNDVNKPAIKEEFSDEITIEEEEIKFDTEQPNSFNDVDNLATKEEFSDEITIEEEEIKLNTEQPNNFNDVDNLATKEEFSDEITIEEEEIKLNTEQPNNFNYVDNLANKGEFSHEVTHKEAKLNFNTERAHNDDEKAPNKNYKEKKQKKTKTNKDLVDKKTKKFEVSGTKKSFLDPKHWLKINLTEDEASEEFRSKAKDRKYLSAAYQCTDCYKGFSKEDMLNRHKLRHSESLGPVECRFCKMRFKIKCYLTRHITQHYTKYKCLRCDLTCPLETTALLHNDYHNGVIRKCMHCEEEFRHLSTYYTHLRTHRSEHVCTLCGASFVSVAGLCIHKKIKHVNADSELPQGEEQYCQRCDVKFETRKAYEEHFIHSAMHVDGIEDSDINAPITSNPSSSKRRWNLKRPRRIPTDCHICGKHFATQAACRKHHLAEHPHTSFSAHNERQICEICGMSLSHPGSVSSHLNTHTREKLYTCNTCGRQFSSKGGMTKHQLTHTSEKPVACTLCDKRFKQVTSMKLHYRTFHLKEPYPKRNRKKKTDELSKEDYGHEDSDSMDG